ncbi:MAG: hypothetical protein H7Z19_17250, partial [Chitinophagaceae bacterium]|nr:hypothetical protein [Rubrivivax sp.]
MELIVRAADVGFGNTKFVTGIGGGRARGGVPQKGQKALDQGTQAWWYVQPRCVLSGRHCRNGLQDLKQRVEVGRLDQMMVEASFARALTVALLPV